MVAIKIESTDDPIFPHYPPRPRCPLCGVDGRYLTKLITRTSNRNKNAGRPYIKCLPCDRFITFLDDRGKHKVNPKCACGKPTRIQVASQRKGRGLHYVCSTGACGHYSIALDSQRKQINLSEDMVDKLASLQLI